MNRVFDILDMYRETGHKPDVFAAKRKGVWQLFGSREYIESAELIGMGLIEMGFRKGDRIISINNHNIPEWNFLDMGMGQLGVIHVPVYPYLSTEDLRYIISLSEPRLIIVDDETAIPRIRDILDSIRSGIEVYTFFPRNEGPSLHSIMDLGRKNRSNLNRQMEEIRKEISGDDLTTLIYTSGTTGNPKGVMLTHSNLVSNILTSSSLHPLGASDRVLSLLPLCHIYERTSNYQFQLCKTSIYYAENFASVIENLKELRANGLVVVPRVLEKVFEAFRERTEHLQGPSRFLAMKALKLAEEYRTDHRNNLVFRLKQIIYNILVFKKLRTQLGGRIRFIGVGGASFSPKIEKFMWTARLRTFQGYGLTETSPLISLNRLPLKNHRIGTVGPVIPGVEVKIASDGEILCRGPNVMKGYLHDEAGTKKAVDEQGWFRTGDMGVMVDDRFLQISGRKKEIFKTSYGKFISPQRLEEIMRESVFIENIMVVGEGKKYAAALISPNFNRLRIWMKEQGKKVPGSTHRLISHPMVVDLIKNEVELQNRQLGDSERIIKYALVPETWGIKTGEITLSLKLKREILHQRYEDTINSLF